MSQQYNPITLPKCVDCGSDTHYLTDREGNYYVRCNINKNHTIG